MQKNMFTPLFTNSIFLLFLLPLFLFSAEKISYKKMTALPGSVLYTAPAYDSTLLCKLQSGTLLYLLPGKDSTWAKVLLPEKTFLWALSSGIDKKTRTLKNNVPLRMGPGAFYPLAGRSKGGEKVTLYEKSPQKVWQKIRLQTPSLITCCPAKFLQAPKKESPAQKKKSSSASKRVFEEPSSAEGVLFLLPEKEQKGTVKYALAIVTGREHYIRAYIQGPPELLARWNNRHIKISGKKFWLKGFSKPVFQAEKIEPGWTM